MRKGVATGRNHGAIMTNDTAVEASAVAAGSESGDLTFPMPYCPEFYQEEFASAVADMKNSVKDRSNAQASCAAQFIASHLGDYIESKPWIHIDMAYPSHRGERATGYGVALLHNLLARL